MSAGMKVERGVSLIEALVAMGVMAFGMVAVVGVQSTLRVNSDISKQRSEAVRLAQDAVEQARSFTSLSADPDHKSYAEVISIDPATVTGFNVTNTSFEIEVRVAAPLASDAQRMKTVSTEVKWKDRTDSPQHVVLNTAIAGVVPGLSGTLGTPPMSTTTLLPGGRNASIPGEAVTERDGTIRFTPPGAGTVSWIFNGVTGYITRLCSAPETCIDVNARLLTGFVRFATVTTQPTPQQAEIPPSVAFDVGVVVDRTAPSALTVGCYVTPATGLNFIEYFCAVPLAPDGGTWSGASRLIVPSLAANLADVATSNFKVCRYTKYQDQRAVPVPPATPTATSIKNEDHPQIYVGVPNTLVGQNFLVIRSGNGTEPFVCPNDDLLTPDLNGTTWHHQPAA